MGNSSTPTQTPRYGNVIEVAQRIAREMNVTHVGVDHLFLAIIRDSDAVPTQILADLVDVDALERRLLGVMNSPAYKTSSPTPEALSQGDGRTERRTSLLRLFR